jgi:NAD(P)H-hydrate repair Nnr-like enzyme with NAD(P)H-hydrate epimerase domain
MDKYLESKILEKNAEFLGIDLLAFYDNSAQKISNFIIDNFKFKSISIICGLGGNSADGLAIANYLAENEYAVTVYLVGRPSSFINGIAKRIWEHIQTLSKHRDNLKVKQDAFANDIEQKDLVIECLTGTGLVGEKLNKRFRDVVKRISHFDSEIIAIDKPTLHYTPDLTISLSFPKTEFAEVINIDYPKELNLFCGPGEKSVLWQPNLKSHTSKNGKVLLVTSRLNNENIQSEVKSYKAKLDIFSFEPSLGSVIENKTLNAHDLESLIDKTDSLLFQNIDENIITYATVNQIIKTNLSKPMVITESIINFIELDNLRKAENILLVLKSENLEKILGKSDVSLEGKVKRFCIENQVNIILVGVNILLFSKSGDFKSVRNVKKQSLDAIANRAAVYASKNDLWISARAAI